MPQQPPDDDGWGDEFEAARTALEAIPHGLIADDTPTQPAEVPAQLFAGYDAGKADGLREGRIAGVYEVIRDLRAVLIAGKNDPEFVETCTALLARRARVPWPPPG